MQGHYKLTYWSQDNCLFGENLVVEEQDVLVPSETWYKLQAIETADFLKFIVDDGEEMIVPSALIINLKQRKGD
ncbi:hypothetical protein [Apilactobacillus xinyiensis]|uniref:hypothetical protein n=1 Tax=Apilactobacillus xinyiensis TaxID=2841032 RepID=UPI00200D11B8|nr:hypothetical protein [Apilactobacillus xinyiensis]MCL0330595.1 hypothetical protein [Apilactobacillus xinyiensis]